MLYPLQLLYLTMANLDSNTTPKLKSLPEAAGKFFAGINAGIREAEKKARDEADVNLSDSDKQKIANLRKTIETNTNKITNIEKLADNIIKKRNKEYYIKTYKLEHDTNIKLLADQLKEANQTINNVLQEKYAKLQNDRRTVREEARKRRREPDSLPELENDLKRAENENAFVQAAQTAEDDQAALLQGSDEVTREAKRILEEPELEDAVEPKTENELPTITEYVPAPATAQAEEILPAPPTEKATTDANKLAKVLVDSLLSATQSSIKMPPAPPLPTEEVEADAPAPFAVTAKPQPAPVVEPTNAPAAAAVAETIVNALEDSQNAVELPTTATPAPVQVTQEPTITAPITISPGALANVIVNAIKLASATPTSPVQGTQAQAPTPTTAPIPVQGTQVEAPIPAPVPVQGTQGPTILPGALANVIVKALKLASTQAVTTPETVPVTAPETIPALSTSPEPEPEPEPEPVTPTNTGVLSSESPGFIALIQKYLEPIIGQFSPPETKPQKVFDIEQLPKDMQKILLNDANIKYIGRYRTETKPGKNELSKDAHQQTTYLFWDTSNHDYISHTLTDVVNDIPVEKARVAKTIPAVTSNELVEKLQLLPRTMPVKQSQKDPLDKKRRIGETNKSAVSFDNMI